MTSKREQRRQEQQTLTSPAPGNMRPTFEPRALADDDPRRCPARTGAVHDFSSGKDDDPPGSGLRSYRCWYCAQLSPRSQVRIAEWRLRQNRG